MCFAALISLLFEPLINPAIINTNSIAQQTISIDRCDSMVIMDPLLSLTPIMLRVNLAAKKDIRVDIYWFYEYGNGCYYPLYHARFRRCRGAIYLKSCRTVALPMWDSKFYQNATVGPRPISLMLYAPNHSMSGKYILLVSVGNHIVGGRVTLSVSKTCSGSFVDLSVCRTYDNYINGYSGTNLVQVTPDDDRKKEMRFNIEYVRIHASTPVSSTLQFTSPTGYTDVYLMNHTNVIVKDTQRRNCTEKWVSIFAFLRNFPHLKIIPTWLTLLGVCTLGILVYSCSIKCTHN
ncbi:envelope glycoprotein D [Psittacid alphaherpesvirus 5]|uniref:Envelope glycoprotein D n=1 Tax=Psittacid alphaherpesvirus 5 TaxID=2972693 RepID=A0A5P9JSG9_9ALPH|nr:envelope glycoprotein D [Psittacid alphaherpesvirus 5]QFU14616.1 envelope glycoprotein D [Psittacid alphaherpesvirus 5]UOO01087.1 envelope glycoprotein D [Psittacid alphaherpesvirus 5]